MIIICAFYFEEEIIFRFIYIVVQYCAKALTLGKHCQCSIAVCGNNSKLNKDNI